MRSGPRKKPTSRNSQLSAPLGRHPDPRPGGTRRRLASRVHGDLAELGRFAQDEESRAGSTGDSALQSSVVAGVRDHLNPTPDSQGDRSKSEQETSFGLIDVIGMALEIFVLGAERLAFEVVRVEKTLVVVHGQ
jgi:hypothetical protein